MANLPGVNEIRSTSRFGLSVVTIVFEDDMGNYLPRQLVSEQLTEVEIPEGFGEQFMGPITRSEEHTFELQSLMRISYAVFSLEKTNITLTSATRTRQK